MVLNKKVGIELLVEKRTREKTLHLQKELALLRLKNSELQKDLDNQNMLVKEVHHRVKNNLQIVASLLNLQSNKVGDDRCKRLFKQNQERVKTMALIHERLYNSENMTQINLADYLKSLVKGLVISFSAGDKEIVTDLKLEPIICSLDIAIPCGLIVNELVTNSIKYAFPDKITGEISVSLSKANEQIQLSVKDNGKGIPKEKLAVNGTMGMLLVDMLVKEQLKGELEFLYNRGSVFVITFDAN